MVPNKFVARQILNRKSYCVCRKEILQYKWRGFIKESSNNDLDQYFLKALEDDLNSPQALMRLQQIFNELKKSPKDEELSNYFNTQGNIDLKRITYEEVSKSLNANTK